MRGPIDCEIRAILKTDLFQRIFAIQCLMQPHIISFHPEIRNLCTAAYIAAYNPARKGLLIEISVKMQSAFAFHPSSGNLEAAIRLIGSIACNYIDTAMLASCIASHAAAAYSPFAENWERNYRRQYMLLKRLHKAEKIYLRLIQSDRMMRLPKISHGIGKHDLVL